MNHGKALRKEIALTHYIELVEAHACPTQHALENNDKHEDASERADPSAGFAQVSPEEEPNRE